MGRQAPGANNVVDGLLRFKERQPQCELIGFINGVQGIISQKFIEITRDNFKNHMNLGGIDFIGRGPDKLRDDMYKVGEVCVKQELTGLILVGGVNTLSEAAGLTLHLIENKIRTSVIVIPCTVDGNIHHKYIQTSIGFDTASKVYSQLIGNMLTDSASACKYWYFIRLMGKEPSHLAVECALQTCPNMVVVSEECHMRKDTLKDVVDQISDLICERSAEGRNYGCVLIPEGLL